MLTATGPLSDPSRGSLKSQTWFGENWAMLTPFMTKCRPVAVNARLLSEISVVPAVGSDPT